MNKSVSLEAHDSWEFWSDVNELLQERRVCFRSFDSVSEMLARPA